MGLPCGVALAWRPRGEGEDENGTEDEDDEGEVEDEDGCEDKEGDDDEKEEEDDVEELEEVTAVRCRRCERAGADFCIRQREDLTTLISASNPFHIGIDGSEEALDVEESMLYCLDPALAGDKHRLLSLAADMLHHHHQGANHVHDTKVSAACARGFALPMWHGNDAPGNKEDPEYRARTPAAYFGEVAARRERIWVELELRARIKKAEEVREAQEAEKRSVEAEMMAANLRTEEAQKAKEELIKKEKDMVRMFYREQGSPQDKARRKAELRRIIAEQFVLTENTVTEVALYLEELIDGYIEEIKLGLRTELPF